MDYQTYDWVTSWMKKPVSSETYSTDYFLSECEGYSEFDRSHGSSLSKRLAVCMEYAGLSAGNFVLDLGAGRGEVLRHTAALGAFVTGVDYSADAIRLARESLADLPEQIASYVTLVQSDAKSLPFRDGTFDRVLMFDIVEHLHPWELELAFSEVRRVLRPNGSLLVHTMPNIWYYRFGYPVYRALSRVAGKRLPRNPRDRWTYVGHVHVNEQSVNSLGSTLSKCGFRSRVWLRQIDDARSSDGPIIRFLRPLLGNVYPFRFVFCNDIFAEAQADPLARAEGR